MYEQAGEVEILMATTTLPLNRQVMLAAFMSLVFASLHGIHFGHRHHPDATSQTSARNKVRQHTRMPLIELHFVSLQLNRLLHYAASPCADASPVFHCAGF